MDRGGLSVCAVADVGLSFKFWLDPGFVMPRSPFRGCRKQVGKRSVLRTDPKKMVMMLVIRSRVVLLLVTRWRQKDPKRRKAK